MEGALDTTTMHNKKYRTYIPTPEPGSEPMSSGNEKPPKVEVVEEKPRASRHPVIMGYAVWHWPEFKALAKRLGIEYGAPITNLVIRIPVDGTVEVDQTSYGQDTTEEKQ